MWKNVQPVKTIVELMTWFTNSYCYTDLVTAGWRLQNIPYTWLISLNFWTTGEILSRIMMRAEEFTFKKQIFLNLKAITPTFFSQVLHHYSGWPIFGRVYSPKRIHLFFWFLCFSFCLPLHAKYIRHVQQKLHIQKNRSRFNKNSLNMKRI